MATKTPKGTRRLIALLTAPFPEWFKRLFTGNQAAPQTPVPPPPAPLQPDVQEMLADVQHPRHGEDTSGAAHPAPPPPGHDDRRGAFTLGGDVNTGVEVCISEQAQRQGLIHQIGVSGCGKTTNKLNLILQALRTGNGLALVEPAGDLTKAVIATMPEEQVSKVVLLNLMDCGEESFALNIFERPEPYTVTEVAKTASQVFHIFEKAWGIGPQTPQLAMVLRHVTRTLIENRATFAEIPLLLQDAAVREAMVTHITNPHTRAFWQAYNAKSGREQAELTASTLNKVDAYLQEGIANILSQERSTIDFRRIMDEGKVLLVLLSPQLEEMSRLIGSMVIAGILRAAFSRADTPEEHRRPFGLYVDEFQHFATQDFATIIHEARKWRLSPVVLSHQTLGQLDAANRAAVAGASTRIVFRVSAEDAKALAPSFDTTPTREMVGEEPIRVPVADVIGHLVRRGHPAPQVARFAKEFLDPLEQFLRTPHPLPFSAPVWPVPYDCFAGWLHLSEREVLTGKRVLNDCLYQCMVEGHPNVQIPPLALYVLAASQADGRAYILSFLLTSTSLEFLGPHILTGFRERAHDFGHPSFLTPAYVQRLTQSAPKKYRWMVEAVVRMIHALRSCMEILAREPILVDSGRYQPKYQRRMYADMEGEIVNELSSKLPNYHAKVRLLSGEEHLIRTNPAPQGLTEDLLIDRMTRIKRQMRVSGYVREVREVEEEVRKRHEQLRRPVQEPPRRRHTGEPRPRRTG